MPHKILSPAAICLPCQREVAAPPARPEGLPRPQMPPAETPHFVGADSISARGRSQQRRPPVRAAPKIRPNQAPLSKGAGCGQSPQTGGLPRHQLPPPGAPPKRALPSVNGISRRNNPSVLAALGHLPLTREAKTAPTAANRADMESAPTRVCHNAWPRPSRSAQNIKFIRRGGIHPAREPRAAIGTPGFAPRLKYTPNRPPCQRGLAAGKARRLGDCPAPKCRPREPAQSGIAPRQTTAPGGPPKRAPFRQRHFKAKQSLRPRFARPPPFDKGGQTRRRKVPGPLQSLPARRYSSPSPCRMARMVSRSAAVAGSIGGAQNGCIGTPRSAIACLMVGTNCGATS